MKKQTYYEQLTPIVMNYLVAYKDDFLVHDKRGFKDFQGEFLFGMRETGTNLLKFEGTVKPDKRFNELVNAFLFQSNDRFFHGKDGWLVEINQQKAEKIYEAAKAKKDMYFSA